MPGKKLSCLVSSFYLPDSSVPSPPHSHFGQLSPDTLYNTLLSVFVFPVKHFARDNMQRLYVNTARLITSESTMPGRWRCCMLIGVVTEKSLHCQDVPSLVT